MRSQNAEKHDDAAGPGRGFVDVFDTDGHLLRRLVSAGRFNSPWERSRARRMPSDDSAATSLVGNFGDGRINVFDDNGRFIDQLEGADGRPLVLEGLWTLTLGGGKTSSSDTLYFTSGPAVRLMVYSERLPRSRPFRRRLRTIERSDD